MNNTNQKDTTGTQKPNKQNKLLNKMKKKRKEKSTKRLFDDFLRAPSVPNHKRQNDINTYKQLNGWI